MKMPENLRADLLFTATHAAWIEFVDASAEYQKSNGEDTVKFAAVVKARGAYKALADLIDEAGLTDAWYDWYVYTGIAGDEKVRVAV